MGSNKILSRYRAEIAYLLKNLRKKPGILFGDDSFSSVPQTTSAAFILCVPGTSKYQTPLISCIRGYPSLSSLDSIVPLRVFQKVFSSFSIGQGTLEGIIRQCSPRYIIGVPVSSIRAVASNDDTNRVYFGVGMSDLGMYSVETPGGHDEACNYLIPKLSNSLQTPFWVLAEMILNQDPDWLAIKDELPLDYQSAVKDSGTFRVDLLQSIDINVTQVFNVQSISPTAQKMLSQLGSLGSFFPEDYPGQHSFDPDNLVPLIQQHHTALDALNVLTGKIRETLEYILRGIVSLGLEYSRKYIEDNSDFSSLVKLRPKFKKLAKENLFIHAFAVDFENSLLYYPDSDLGVGYEGSLENLVSLIGCAPVGSRFYDTLVPFKASSPKLGEVDVTVTFLFANQFTGGVRRISLVRPIFP